jgi:hypothetical protein
VTERLKAGLGGLLVAALALGALGSTALHANGAQTRLTSAQHQAAAARADAYYACLSAQAHSLIGAGNVVYLPRPTLGQWATLTKVIGGWARTTLQVSRANLALTLQHSGRAGSCDGDDLIAITRQADGHVVIARGRS